MRYCFYRNTKKITNSHIITTVSCHNSQTLPVDCVVLISDLFCITLSKKINIIRYVMKSKRLKSMLYRHIFYR